MVALTVLAACGGDDPTPTPAPTATAVAILPTSTPVQVAAAAVEVQAVAATDTPAPVVPAATDTPSAPTNTPEPLPPLLLESNPAQGSNWDGGPVRFTFDQPLAPDSALAVTVKPDLGGSAVVDGDALVFTPAQAAQEGVSYTFRLGAEIASAQGIPMPGAEEVSLALRTPLMVTNITPGDGNRDVATDAQITLVFNRPVVELVGVADQANLPQPLAFSPDVAGTGQWVSTSVYVFSPETGLAGSTDYAGVIADLTAVDGGVMAGPVSFGFRTAAPVVAGIDVSGNMVRPDTAITVLFSQPMDRASTEAAFSLTLNEGGVLPPYPAPGTSAPIAPPGTTVAGAFVWTPTDTGFVFTPDEWLTFGKNYLLTVNADAQPASRQGTLRHGFRSQFQVVSLPSVIRTDPSDRRTNVATDAGVTVYFNAPLSQTLVMENIHIRPEVTSTQVYSWYSDYDQRLFLNWGMEAQTQYTITLGRAMGDEYGNTLGEDYVFGYTTGDLPQFASLNVDRFTHFSAYTMPVVAVSYRNVEKVDVELYRLPLAEFYKLTGENQWQIWENYRVPSRDANLIWARSLESSTDRNKIGYQPVKISDADGDLLPPGLYFLDVRTPGDASRSDAMQAIFVLSHHNLLIKKTISSPSLVWLTDLRTGQPLADQTVNFVSYGQALGSGITDADGIAQAQLDINPEQPWVEVLAVTGEPGAEGFAVASSAWSQGIGSWEYGIGQGYETDPYRSVFYTERPIYRPGQTVHWKGIVRQLAGEDYVLPAQELPIHITIRDDRGNTVQELDVTPNAHGTVDGLLELAPEATTGYYYLEARILTGTDRYSYGGAGFQVASYRKPEFQISVTPALDEVTQGQMVTVTMQADYFSGGPLANAPVDWRILAEPFTFSWPDAPKGRWFSFDTFDPNQDSYDPYAGFFYGLIKEGTDKTDAQGRFDLSVPADLADSLASQRWSFDLTVQSPTNQFVSGNTAVVVHKGDFYIGLSPRSYVISAGSAAEIDVVTLQPDYAPYPDAALQAVVYQFNWNSVFEKGPDGVMRWTTNVERIPVYTDTLTTDTAGQGLLTWTPETGGQYQIALTGQDERGNGISAATFVWVSDRRATDFVPWPRDNNDRIELVADKKLYEPGDVAKVLVPSPFVSTESAPVMALISVERAGILEHSVIQLDGNSQTLEFPITVESIPNIYISVVLVKGVDETNDVPAMRVGYVQLNVDLAQKELTLDIQPSATQVRPGETVSYTVNVADAAGNPVPNAELSAVLVDKAILTLAQGQMPDLLNVFYYQRPLGVETGALLVINRDRISQQVAAGGKGGGGGGDMGGLEVRQDFPDIAFWQADLVTDEEGRTTFSVDLPDNLTTWVLQIVAASDETLVGSASNEVVASKELLIRPALPRFLTAGDRAVIGALVQNNSNTDLAGGSLALDLQGASLTQGNADGNLALAAGETLRQSWTIQVDPGAAEVVVTMIAQGGSLNDAVKVVLPVVRYETPEVVGSSGTVPASGRLEAIRVPTAATDQGELLVTLDPSLADGLLDGLAYLQHYPYECNEQTVSRFLPNLFTVRAFAELGLDNKELEKDLAYQLGIGLQRLVNRQNGDGGWGYWNREESRPFISAYVLWGLWNADQMGYSVPPATLLNGMRFLDRNFVAPSDLANNWQYNEMAFVHFVLAEMGQGDAGRMTTLFAVRERMDLYGKAYLAMAMADVGLTEQANTLLDDLAGRVEISAAGAMWAEGSVDWWNMNTDTRSTAIALAAFTRLRPDWEVLPQAVRWLMSARQARSWTTTQETAWALIGLTDWMVQTGELQPDYNWTAQLNGAPLGNGSFTAETAREQTTLRTAITDLLRDQANALRLGRVNNGDGDTGQLYYTTQLRYFLDATAVPALDRGFVVERSFAAADGAKIGQTVNSAAVGDVISVTVRMVVPSPRYHVLVEVPIPAGTEPIDTSLATTSDAFGDPQFEQEGQSANPYWWSYWTPTATDIRDDKVALFATNLQPGTYAYTFLVQATTPGEFRVLPAQAAQMYFPDVWGRSAGALFSVTE
ncbi:MAG: Ig-like domain-containing protein [Caldilineaceae bacterium]|nr:Ig-like domain-containing protein [Caldilineaceae bacterium]MBP8106605.1 Ig-like domain-containing protein [Caldilineaceae bacterium]MBP8121312.1 Ig-like domain-containing protein [Caldilineaceae bacterium]MBP9070878.1 Ig-like domain-containing protein [Caldilineaceae bacterium]